MIVFLTQEVLVKKTTNILYKVVCSDLCRVNKPFNNVWAFYKNIVPSIIWQGSTQTGVEMTSGCLKINHAPVRAHGWKLASIHPRHGIYARIKFSPNPFKSTLCGEAENKRVWESGREKDIQRKEGGWRDVEEECSLGGTRGQPEIGNG